MSKSINLDQMSLVIAINQAISDQLGDFQSEPRLMNAVFSAASSICDEFARESVMATPNMGLAAWFASDDVGQSSKFMATCLSGGASSEFAEPYDVADFARCVRMVNAAPELKSGIPTMAIYSPVWEMISSNWDRWCRLLEADPQRLYSELKEAHKLK